MVEFRQQIVQSNDPIFKILQTSNDFYSVSTLRDLVFHVQEHHFTIPRISNILDELGLSFIGFEFSNELIIKDYKSSFPKVNSIYNLHQWHEYESTHPRIFSGMYQFWTQKL